MKDLRITLIQSKLHWQNPIKNRHMFDGLFDKIKTGSTDIILLPEMFTTGFSMLAETYAETMNGVTLNWLKNMAGKKKAVVCGSLMIKEKKKYYNRLIWMKPDGSYQTYDKRHLFSMANEEDTYSAGKDKIVVEWKGWKICPMICYDLRFPVWSRRTKDKNYDLLLFVANWPERRAFHWKQLLVARAIENQAFVAGLNRIGLDGNGIAYTGDSAIIDPLGHILSKIKPSQTKVETIVISAKLLKNWRKQLKAFSDADAFDLKK